MADILHLIGIIFLIFSVYYYLSNFKAVNKDIRRAFKKWIKNARTMYADVYGPYYYQIKEIIPFTKRYPDNYKQKYHSSKLYHRRMMKPNKK